MRIAGGEMVRIHGEMERALQAAALDVVQPDVVLCVGASPGLGITLDEDAVGRYAL